MTEEAQKFLCAEGELAKYSWFKKLAKIRMLLPMLQ